MFKIYAGSETLFECKRYNDLRYFFRAMPRIERHFCRVKSDVAGWDLTGFEFGKKIDGEMYMECYSAYLPDEVSEALWRGVTKAELKSIMRHYGVEVRSVAEDFSTKSELWFKGADYLGMWHGEEHVRVGLVYVPWHRTYEMVVVGR